VGAFFDVFAEFFGSTVGEFLVLRRRKKLSGVAGEIYSAGLPARISGCVYGLGSRTGSSWVGGVFEVESGVVVWHAGYVRRSHGRRIASGEFTAVSLRVPTTRESWAVDTSCAVLIGEIAKRRVEIAVLQDDMSLLLDALKATRLLD
jgi:hypothetical protein